MEDKEDIKTYKIVGYAVIVFVILGFVAMFGGAVYTRSQKIGVIYCEFPYIGDVRFDDAFTMNGYKVGFVKDISAGRLDRTILTIYLKAPITVHEGYKLFIGDVGIMGERVVCVENGPQDAPIVSQADTLKGVYYPGISDMLGRILELRDILDDAMLFVDKISHGTDSTRSIIEWINNAQDAIDKFLLSMKNTMVPWDKDIPEILEKIDDLNENFDSDLTDLRKKLPDIIKKTDAVLNGCDTILIKLAQVEKAAKDAKKFVVGVDSLDINSINGALTDLHGELSNVYYDAVRLKILFGKDPKNK